VVADPQAARRRDARADFADHAAEFVPERDRDRFLGDGVRGRWAESVPRGVNLGGLSGMPTEGGRRAFLLGSGEVLVEI
jgi:hypothetical protein